MYITQPVENSNPLGGGFSCGSDVPRPEIWLGYTAAIPEDRPMTMHIVIRPPDGGIAWVTDMGSTIGTSNSIFEIDKITYLDESDVAVSACGNHGVTIRNELAKWISRKAIDLSTSASIKNSLETFCMAMLQGMGINPKAPNRPSVVMVTGPNTSPRIYFAQTGTPPAVDEAENLICIGDEDNPCRIFVDQYFKESKRTTAGALFLGVHAMRKANQLKAAYIGEPNAYVRLPGSMFRRLTNTELEQCINASKALDAKILADVGNFILDTGIIAA